jgi:hypothetical protein
MPGAGTNRQLDDASTLSDRAGDMRITPSAVLGEFGQLCVAMSVSGALIAVREMAGMRCTVSFGNAPGVGSRLGGDSAFTKHCVETGEVVLCDDAASDLRLGPLVAARMGFRSAVAVPIEAQGSVVGVIQVFCPEASAIAPGAVADLQRIAKQFAALMIFDAANGGELIVGGSVEEPILLPRLIVDQGPAPNATDDGQVAEKPASVEVAAKVESIELVAEPERQETSQPSVAPRLAVARKSKLSQLPSDRRTPSRVWLIAGVLLLALSILLLFLFMSGSHRQDTSIESRLASARAEVQVGPRV